MNALWADSAAKFARLIIPSFWPPRDSAARRSLRRVLVMALLLPGFALLQLVHWIGFALDAVFFRGYRKVVVREPLFVTGVPRSGTTMLHRTLSEDAQYTTFTTWECLFAPSVTERRVVLGLAALDRTLGGPLARAIGWLERRAFGGLEDVHGMSLSDAEEDYFVFMPLVRCFILVVPFPFAPWLWDMGQFDRRVPDAQRRRIMRYYHDCIRRHLYVHGTEKRFLSKNASFPPLLASLLAEFPDARFAFCLRDPLQVVPSQLSSLRGGMEFFGNDPYDKSFRDRIVGQLLYYYQKLLETPVPAGQYRRVEMAALRDDVAATIAALYQDLGLQMSPQYRDALARQAVVARSYRSAHVYSLEEYGLDAGRLRETFATVYAQLDYGSVPQ